MYFFEVINEERERSLADISIMKHVNQKNVRRNF